MAANPIKEMLDIADALIEIIEKLGACPDVTTVQQMFSATVGKAIKAYQEGKIEVDIRSMPPVMYTFTMEELPHLCKGNEDDLNRAKQQLKLFITSIRELVNPMVNE